jgi:Fe-S oxidoreductase
MIRLPAQGCCGRPAISKGLLDQAMAMAISNITDLPDYEQYIFLEPSCQSAFIDEYPTLVPSELQAKARDIASRCQSAERWLLNHVNESTEIEWRQTPDEILLHGHCHQKSLWGTQDSRALLKLIPGATVTEIDSGCCGMAGSFGYEHEELSWQIAEQRLLPAVRAKPDARVAAPGTSCRQQLADAGHMAYHPIEILARCL